jgi:competence protein ComEA
VAYPGVYELPVGSRIYQALALAGGMTVDAAPTAVNQAEPLTDGEMIQIPTVEEEQEQQAEEQERSDGLVNINTATLEELKTLPGIGDARARSIIAYRESNGAFASIQDIKNIDGIGDGMFSRLESCIKVN